MALAAFILALAALVWLAWQRRIKPPAWLAPWDFYAHNGFIAAIIGVIISVVSTVASVAISVGSVIWNTVNDAIGGLARGLTWLWNGTKKFFDVFSGALKHIFNDVVGKWLTAIYGAYTKLENALQNFFGPLIKVFNRIMTIWRMYVQPYVRLVLNIIQRIRLALKVLEALHIKWAKQLDQELADIEGKIIHNDLVIYGYLTDVANVINDLVDPLRLLRTNIMVRSFLAAFDSLSLALIGTKWGPLLGFEQLIGAGPGGTARIDAVMMAGAADVMGRTGDAGVIANRAPAMRSQLFSELGLPQITNV